MIPVERLEAVVRRSDEIDRLLCEPEVLRDLAQLNQLNRERSQISPLVLAFVQWRSLTKQIVEDTLALDDPELGEIARGELPGLQAQVEKIEKQIQFLLLPKDPNDEKNTLLEIRAGTGGEEAALFAANLFRMYAKYAERRGWKLEVLSQSDASAGGFKEIIALVSGQRIFSRLKHEGGVHRVQRVPQTEAQGRVHTSTATVAVLPEADEVDFQLNEADLRFDIAASGGPGGQGVNTTNSSVQVTHLPTGLVVRCQDERSQIKNRSRAMKILRSRLLERERQKQAQAIRDERRSMVKGGDRSEKIRTYNFPQNRITDHRVPVTLYKLDLVMEGDLDELLETVGAWHQAAELDKN
ncbi:MAG TPA: peptide chain release factor 1 [Polyangiaceae bacterium]|jgi:peptide chain release factor 1